MATASVLAFLRGRPTYKEYVCPNLVSPLALYVNRPRKTARTEAVAIFYEIVYKRNMAHTAVNLHAQKQNTCKVYTSAVIGELMKALGSATTRSPVWFRQCLDSHDSGTDISIALYAFFSSLSLLFFFFSFSPLFQNLYFSSLHEIISILALFSCLSLAPVRPGCSLFLASFPSFSL